MRIVYAQVNSPEERHTRYDHQCVSQCFVDVHGIRPQTFPLVSVSLADPVAPKPGLIVTPPKWIIRCPQPKRIDQTNRILLDVGVSKRVTRNQFEPGPFDSKSEILSRSSFRTKHITDAQTQAPANVSITNNSHKPRSPCFPKIQSSPTAAGAPKLQGSGFDEVPFLPHISA